MRIFLKNMFGICTSWVPVAVMARLTGQKIILPFYHAVSDEILPHLRYSYRIRTIRQFIHDLEFFLRFYLPVNFSDLMDIINGTMQVKKPVMALSFDD